MSSTPYKIDMTTGAVLPKLIAFALPLMATNILQLLFAAADSIVVGRFAGEDALAAVGATVSLISLLTNLFLGLSIGANVAAAYAFGAKDETSLSNAVHTSISLALITGVILTLVGFFSAEQLLIWMKTPDDILRLSVIYLRIYFFGMTAMMVYNFGSALLRAVGDTKRPLTYLTLSGILNVLLNLLFVIVFRLGVVGVAIATVITQVLSAVLVVLCLMNESGGIRFSVRKLCLEKVQFYKIVSVGLPAGIQSSMYSISNVVIQSAINIFGTMVVAANTAAINLEDIVYFTLNAVQQAVTSFTGQNMGVRDFARIRRVQFMGHAVTMMTAAVLIGGEMLFAAPLLGIFSDKADVVTCGVERMWYIIPFYWICGVMEIFVGGLRGLGKSLLPTLISLTGVCFVRLSVVFFIFPMEAFHKITTVYMLYPITWSLTAIAEGIAFCVILKKMSKSF